jgi:hypothetical protein
VNITKARKEFKSRFGQANHFLITTLVGLDAIEKGFITEKGATFSTSWNPKNTKISAQRSRIFVLKSFLVSAVESLEMYITSLNKKPKLLQSDIFLRIYSSSGQSIYKSVIGVADQIKVDPILTGLMEILITWRNYVSHYDIDNEIRIESWEILLNNSESIKSRFSGLDIVQLKDTWENNKDFTFKESASLIKATQLFVEEIDEYIIDNINIDQYVIDNLERYFQNKLFLQRFKSSNKKEIYLGSVIKKLVGVKNYTVNIELINKVKNFC